MTSFALFYKYSYQSEWKKNNTVMNEFITIKSIFGQFNNVASKRVTIDFISNQINLIGEKKDNKFR